MTFKIKPAAEIPNNAVRGGRPGKKMYPFDQMHVGTAFVVPANHPGASQLSGGIPRVVMAAHTFARKHGWKFRTNTQKDGSVRIERIA